MPQTEGFIPNLIGGVSQQPAAVRAVTQLEEQDNFLSDPVNGLETRPPSEFLAALGIVLDETAFVHLIDRGEGNQQLLTIDGTNGMRVFDLMSGTSRTVTDSASDSYLTSTNPAQDFTAITEADTTFILNKTITVGKTSARSATRPFEAVVNVRAGQYEQIYRVNLNGVGVFTQTAPANASDIDVVAIAQQLVGEAPHSTFGGTGSTTTLNSTDFPGFTFERIGSTIYISNTVDFTISVDEGMGINAPLTVAKDEIQDFTDLPARSKDGFKVKVIGTPQSAFDDYHVVFEETSGDGQGVWKETIAPDVETSIDPATMPHKLVPNSGDSGFTYSQFEWTSREVGEDSNNPFPSFVGRKINDLWFLRDRFGMLADENVIASEQGSYFNFFRTTVTDLLDSDRIDTPVPSRKVAILRHALPLGENLLVSSKDQQFIFGTTRETLLTPSTAANDKAASFEMDETVSPISIGSYVYFVKNGEQFVTVRELFYDEQRDTQDAIDVSAAIPSYISTDVVSLRGSSNNNTVALISDGDNTRIFIWKYFFNGGERVQSSWSKWTLGDHILSIDIVDGWLYLLRRVANSNTFIERINLESDYTLSGLNYRLNLDRLTDQDSCGVSLSGDDTTITLPYSLSGETVRVVVKAGQSLTEGTLLFEGAVTGASLTVPSVDLTSVNFWVGTKYTCTATLSEQFDRDENGDAGTGQKVKIKNFRVAYSDTGSFSVKVDIGNKTYTYPFTGAVVGSLDYLLGTVNLLSGEFKTPVGGDSKKTTISLLCESYLPAKFTYGSWKGIVTRTR